VSVRKGCESPCQTPRVPGSTSHPKPLYALRGRVPGRLPWRHSEPAGPRKPLWTSQGPPKEVYRGPLWSVKQTGSAARSRPGPQGAAPRRRAAFCSSSVAVCCSSSVAGRRAAPRPPAGGRSCFAYSAMQGSGDRLRDSSHRAVRVIGHPSHRPSESSAVRVIGHPSHRPSESSAIRVIGRPSHRPSESSAIRVIGRPSHRPSESSAIRVTRFGGREPRRWGSKRGAFECNSIFRRHDG
jgi:hypothetical protein